MKYIWLIFVIYMVYRMLSSARRRLPREPQPIPGNYRRPEGTSSGPVLAEQNDDGPLTGPWSRPRDTSPASPESGWGEVPVPRGEEPFQTPAETAGKAGEADTAYRENDGPVNIPEKLRDKEESGIEEEQGRAGADAKYRRRQKYMAVDREGRRCALAGGDGLPCTEDTGYSEVAEAPVRRQKEPGYCRQNLTRLLTPRNIQSGIILAEIMGPRGGRRRR